MTELTPNEKAATFLGWKPERICSGLYYGERRGHQFKIIPCEHGQTNAHVVDNTVGPSPLIHWKDGPAPDMTSPANYIRALEALPVAKFKGLWAIAATRTGYRCFIDLYGEVTGWGDEYNCYLDADGRTVAEAVIGALVQLYDGENKNG